MGTSYLVKDKVYAVCTYQLSSDPEKFSNTRTTPTVFYQNSKQPVLTVADRNLNCQFTCQSPWNIAASLLAFGAGILVTAFLVLSGPIGWVALGIACVALGAVAMVSAAHHKCTGPLQAGKWQMVHSSVKISGEIAITRSSILVCSTGGVLTPFFSEAEAMQAAESIATMNRWGLGINTATAFFAGLFLPETLGAVTGFKAGAILFGKFAAGYAYVTLAPWVTSGAIRGWNENFGSLGENSTYENINKATENPFPFDISTNPSDYTTNPTDIAGVVEAFNSGKLVVTNGTLAAKLSQLKDLTRQQLKSNPQAQQLLSELNDGEYPDWNKNINDNNHSLNSKRMTPSMVDDGRVAAATSFKENLGNMANKGLSALFLLQPIVSAFLSEGTRDELAKAMAKDLAAPGVDMVANVPVD